MDLAKKIADAEAAIAAQKAARAAAESVEARKRRNAAEAKQRAALARAAVSEAGSGSEEQSEWSESGSSYAGSSYGGSGSSRGSSRASSPSRSGSPSRSSPSSSASAKTIEPYLIRVKYLSGVFDIVDMDKRGVIKLKTFLKAVKRVPKIDALLKRGRNKDGRFAGDAAEARRARVFAALERDKKREVTKEQFIRYFVWEIARSDA